MIGFHKSVVCNTIRINAAWYWFWYVSILHNSKFCPIANSNYCKADYSLECNLFDCAHFQLIQVDQVYCVSLAIATCSLDLEFPSLLSSCRPKHLSYFMHIAKHKKKKRKLITIYIYILAKEFEVSQIHRHVGISYSSSYKYIAGQCSGGI